MSFELPLLICLAYVPIGLVTAAYLTYLNLRDGTKVAPLGVFVVSFVLAVLLWPIPVIYSWIKDGGGWR